MPIVSCRPVRKATLSLVPTPSQPATSTGASGPSPKTYAPPKAPGGNTTSGPSVAWAKALIFSTAR